MLIIHGTATKKENLGLVADWCATCRAIRPLQVTRIGKYQHVYFVPVSKTQPVCDEIQCSACNKTSQVVRAEYPAFVDGNDEITLEDLIACTNPDAPAKYRARLDREERLESGEASEADQQAALDEAFDAAAEQCQLIRVRKQIGFLGVMGFLGIITVFVLIIGILASPRFGPVWTDWLMAGVVALGLIPFGMLMVGEASRRCRKKVLPELADRIWPLAPTREQIEAILKPHKEGKTMLGKAFTVDGVLEAMVKSAERWEKKPQDT